MLLLAGMFQCAALALEASAREVLTLLASGFALLCVSLLIEDFAVRPLRSALRGVFMRPRAC